MINDLIIEQINFGKVQSSGKVKAWIVQHQLILANGDDGPLQTIYIDLI